MTTSTSTTPAVTSESALASTSTSSGPDLLPWSPLLCTCLSANDPRTQDLRSLYHEHTSSSLNHVSRCSWYQQAKRAQESYHLRKHELGMKSKIKQEAKELLKQQEEARIAAKRAEGYTCRRCKHSVKFDSNTKLHEHIRTRHAKKPKEPAQQSVESVVSPPTPSVSPSQSVTSSSPTSPKLVAMSLATPPSETPSESSSVATPRKLISWAEIASRPVVAPKPSRLPIATPKLVCKPLENASIACPPTPPRTPTSKHQGIQKPYLTVDDLFRMFAGKPSPFGLQRHQMRSLSPKAPGRSRSRTSGPIQMRITSYFNAAASPASKTDKFEAFPAAHGSVKQSARTSPSWPHLFRPTSRFSSVRPSFSAFSYPIPVCRHCQGRSATPRASNWPMPSASRVGNAGIPMGMRSSWRFAPPRPALGEY